MTFRLALDQNFPEQIVRALTSVDAMPAEIELAALRDIDPRLADMDDRRMIIALHQLGWNGLATNNYRILWEADELAALIATKLVFIAIEGLGDNSIRSTGALLLELPGLPRRLQRKETIFHLRHRHQRPKPAWAYMVTIAAHQDVNVNELFQANQVTPEELATPVLQSR